ncbi:FAD-binding oxidoreductase [Nocardioides mesophilus]|uniref:FAD-binding oxidoreductase n=1 Tax=Nocardioides mesophilus TaxID=433659 RepID=A0A7G9R8X7_9ACTN|nr:FAD-binding oxidoreductase [Nocardioides mesophilus]QNN52052.1 FAD-binding oxidoreductase [Nocardioides mesophilus]
MTSQTFPARPATAHAAAPIAASALRHLCAGRVHVAGDPGYDAARGAWNAAVDQQPAAVALPRSAGEVAEVVRAAVAAGLRVAPQSTGHNAGPLAAQDLSDVVLLRTSQMSGVSIDTERRVARVEAGTVWLPAVEAAAEHGLAALHGSSPDVGIAGYSLGGGIGWYARKLGLATNSLTAVEMVLADGSTVRADATENPELFWAVRGGGGSFGVVTALEFSLFRIATAYAGMLIWDVADAERVLRRWASWAPAAPDEVTTSFRVLHLPPLPDIPEPLRGRSVVVIDGAVLGTDVHGRELLGDLRALRPEIDTFDRVPAGSLVRLHMDPEGPTPVVSDTTMLGSLPDAAVDAFLTEIGPGSGTSLLMGELRQLGGALGRPHEGGGALSHLDAAFVGFAGAMALTPEMAAQGHADAVRLTGALSPWANGRQYLNFAENPVDPRTAYGAEAWRRLAGIRSAVDPDGVFVANHRVPRLFENGRVTV